MKAYELLNEKYKDMIFTDGVSNFIVSKGWDSKLELYLEEDTDEPYRFTAKEIMDLDFKPTPVHFTKAIASEKDIYIKHKEFNYYIKEYLPLNRLLKEISTFEPLVIKDIFANGEWYIKLD